jgi:hypothetical protein
MDYEMTKRKRRSQTRIPGLRRLPGWTCLHPNLKRTILKEALKFNCSPSFVIATALGNFFDMHYEKYYEGD